METEVIRNRLIAVAEKAYPIELNMCAFRKQGIQYKRTAFVWRLERELKLLTEVQIEMVLNELESKTAA